MKIKKVSEWVQRGAKHLEVEVEDEFGESHVECFSGEDFSEEKILEILNAPKVEVVQGDDKKVFVESKFKKLEGRVWSLK